MSEHIPSSANNSASNETKDLHSDIVNRLAFAALNEQRRSRRWNIFFKALFFSYFLLILLMIYFPVEKGAKLTTGKHTALIEVNGIIADNTEANADSIITGLRNAFKDRNTAGVVLRINSPGGSPVQAGYVNDEISRLRDQNPDIKVYAVVTDICASGGYYIAAAADEIYADKASIVGSIGVLMNGFGFVEAMKKMGIERRLYTAGENKGILDPFSEVKPEDVSHVKGMLSNIHEQFIDVVKKGRGDRLVENKEIFSGLFWTGEQAMELGLVDSLGSSSYVAREVIQAENIVNFTPRQNYLERFADRFGAAMANTMMQVFGISQTPVAK
ncbi:MAG: signal peptide peptidase SppA [Thioalkalispiraceae bacterium]|jgi:protease-4